jgi:hypothetical protein
MLHDLGAVWVSFQEAETGLETDDLGQSLMRHSRLYRACLGAHIAQLDACAKSRSDAEHLASGSLPAGHARAYEKQRARVAEYHVVWYLCEILYLATTEEESVTAHLLEWMHMTFYPDFGLVRRIESKAVAVDAAVLERLYSLCRAFILQGCVREAALCLSMLAQHAPGESRYLQVAAALVLETPLVGAATALREFMPRFQLWRAKCARLREAAEAEGCMQSARLLALLSGDERALQACGCTWLELAVAHLLYVDPGQRRSHLPQLVQRCVAVWRGVAVADLPPYQRILHAVFCDDPVLALRVAAAFAQPWFPAHLGDLLHHAGALPPGQEAEGRLAPLLRHVDALPPALWPLALEYLRRLSGPEASARAAALLRRAAPTCDREARSIRRAALDCGLPEAAAGAAQAWTLRLWQDGRRRDALDWASEAGLSSLAAQMVEAAARAPGGLEALAAAPAAAASGTEASPALAFVDEFGGGAGGGAARGGSARPGSAGGRAGRAAAALDRSAAPVCSPV